jgi:molybdopterin synthase catalytic subunit
VIAARGRDSRASRYVGPVAASYDTGVIPPDRDDWLGLTDAPLPVGAAYDWAVRPDCGAVVLFSGTARDHSDGRPEVTVLEYEAYEEHVVPRLQTIVAEARVRWPSIGRVALLHRTGVVPVGESAVVVAVGAPHRGAAFDAARFCIDTLKASVPIWKRETWRNGESWGLEPQHIIEVDQL